MFPAPITIATSTPASWTPAISRASPSTVGRSSPYSRSPMSDSPETLRSTRLNATRCSSSSACTGTPAVTRSVSQGDALERNDLGAGLGEHLRDRLRRLAAPGLVEQHAAGRLREEPLREHPLDDLLLGLLRLALELGRVEVDLLLGLDLLGGDLVTRERGGSAEGDVHRELAPDLLVAALELDEDADLLRRRVDVRNEDVAVLTLKAGAVADRDVLAELGDELDPLVLERGGGLGASPGHRVQHVVGEGAERVVVRHRLGLAADADDRPGRAVDAGEDTALGRLATGPLARLREALLAERALCRFEVSSALDERLLALHHPGARRVAELLDEACADRRHCALSSVLGVASTATSASTGAASASTGAASAAAGAASSVAGAGSAAGSAAGAAGAGASTAAGASAGAAGAAGAAGPAAAADAGCAAPSPRGGRGLLISCWETFALPASIPSASARTTREQERIASSLPGMT